jgi:hypothetical protein
MVDAAMKALIVVLAMLFLLPMAVASTAQERDSAVPWYAQRRDSSGQAPDPRQLEDAVVQVYAARAVGWRAIFAVHTWIAIKPRGAERYTRYEVMGWGVGQGAPAIRVDRTGPDNYWFGAKPTLLVERRGPEAEALVDKIRAAVASYPYPDSYLTWPGPNSNTFVAHIGREVPELGLVLPSTAIGKDFLPGGALLAATPSGTGIQLSLFGLAGVTLALSEGVEINLLGLSLGVSVFPPSLRLPGIGSL